VCSSDLLGLEIVLADGTVLSSMNRMLKNNAGYDLKQLFIGSEGTLGIVVRTKLKLTPLPNSTGLVVLHFDDLLDSLRATPNLLNHEPAAVELIDRMIIDAGCGNAATSQPYSFLRGKPNALMIVEFYGHSEEEVTDKIDTLLGDVESVGRSYAAVQVTESAVQQEVWNLRRSGLGLLMSRPGDRQSYAFVEDAAVQPERLADYMKRFFAILDEEGVEAGCYAHASVGCLHVRPVLNLKSKSDVGRMRRLADAVSDLAIEFGDLTEAERRLREAQEKLSEALENNASQEEIEKLMKELREAMNEFMQQMMEQARNNPMQQNPFDQNNQMRNLTQRDIDKMMDRIEDLAKSGSKDAARELLAEMQRMMDNLRTSQQRQQRQQGGNQMNQALDKLSELMQKQQQLLNETDRKSVV